MFKKLIKNTTFFFSLLLLSSCDANEIGDRIKTTVFDMLPNLWVTLIQLTIFILVVILFMIFAYKPLKKKLNKRSEYIEKNIKDSENAKKEAQEALNKAKDIIKKLVLDYNIMYSIVLNYLGKEIYKDFSRNEKVLKKKL